MLGLQHVTPPFNLEGSLLKELCIKVQEGFRGQARVSGIMSHSYSGITGTCNSGDQSNIESMTGTCGLWRRYIVKELGECSSLPSEMPA